MIKLDQKDMNDLLEFSQTHPWKPHYPKAVVQRFMSELISRETLIFDLHDASGRAAVAVLLDKVINPARDACLEIVGMRADMNQSDVMSRFFDMAEEEITEQAGFQISIEDSLVDEEFLLGLGLKHYYDTFEMVKTDLTQSNENQKSEIGNATINDKDEIYNLLRESFSQNLDTSIPNAHIWKQEFLQSPDSQFFIWREKSKILGFANLITDKSSGESEVRTIGVHSSARGRGIGKSLLHHSLQNSARLKANSCRLNVAVTNEKALSMYLQAGMKVVAKYKCFRMSLKK